MATEFLYDRFENREFFEIKSGNEQIVHTNEIQNEKLKKIYERK